MSSTKSGIMTSSVWYLSVSFQYAIRMVSFDLDTCSSFTCSSFPLDATPHENGQELQRPYSRNVRCLLPPNIATIVAAPAGGGVFTIALVTTFNMYR